MPLFAYFLTFHTYGTHLHGHAEGSVDRNHNRLGKNFLPPSTAREQFRRSMLAHEPVLLDDRRRFVVDTTVRDVCRHRRWQLLALNVRTTHVHVVTIANSPADKVLADFKARCTRRLRELGVVPPDMHVWSHHGSTRYLDSEASVARAIQYTVHEQGEELPMVCPEGWSAGGGHPRLDPTPLAAVGWPVADALGSSRGTHPTSPTIIGMSASIARVRT